MIATDLGAMTAMSAARFVDARYGQAHRVLAVDVRSQKKVRVRFLDVTIEQLGLGERQREISGEKGLAGPALAARNRNNQRLSPLAIAVPHWDN